MTQLTVNGKALTFEAEPDTPLLWVLREQLGLTGTKFGCGAAQCGACTVHLDGAPVRSCVLPVSAVQPRNRSPPSKACRPTAATRCKRPGQRWTCRNAATVKAAC